MQSPPVEKVPDSLRNRQGVSMAGDESKRVSRKGIEVRGINEGLNCVGP